MIKMECCYEHCKNIEEDIPNILKLNINYAYFNNRLGIEYKRIVEDLDYLTDGMNVLDMFAGIGPFAMMCAKEQHNIIVHACEINPAAVDLFNRNILLNKKKLILCSSLNKLSNNFHIPVSQWKS